MEAAATSPRAGRPRQLTLAIRVAYTVAGLEAFGVLWGVGYAFEPADLVSRQQGAFLTAVGATITCLLAILGWTLGRRRPRAFPLARAAAWTGVVLGGSWAILSSAVITFMPVLEVFVPTWASLVKSSPLPPDFTTGPLLVVAGWLAIRAIRLPETRQWFGLTPLIPLTMAV